MQLTVDAKMTNMAVSSKFSRVFTIFGVCIIFVGSFGAHPRSASERKFGELVLPDLHEVRLEKLSKSILAVDIANSSNLAAVALSDMHVRLWNLDSGQVIHEWAFSEPPTDRRLRLDDDVEPISLRFSPDGKTLAVGFLNAIHLYDVETWQEKATLAVSGEDILRPDIKVTPATPQLSRRTAGEANEEKAKPEPTLNQTIKDLSAQRERGDGRMRILSFEFARNGSSMLAAYCRGACYASTWRGHQWMFPTGKDPVRLWDVSSANILWERLYDPKGVAARVAPSPDGKRFAAVNSELGHCAVGVYDLNDGRALWSQALGPCLGPPSVQFLQDSQSFITNRIQEGDRKNKLWRKAAVYDTSTGKKIADLTDSEGIGEANVSSDGRWLASTTWGGRHFQIWDLRAKKVVITQTVGEKKRWLRLDRICLSPDGRWLVVGNNASGDLAVYRFGLS